MFKKNSIFLFSIIQADVVSKWETWREFPCFAFLYGDMWKIFRISSLLCGKKENLIIVKRQLI